MKITPILLTVSLFLSFLTFVQAGETPMADKMNESNKALKNIRKIQRKQPTDWDALALAARTAHEAFVQSLAYIPRLIEEMPDGVEKVSAIADSRRLMGLAYAAMCELELAYLSKDQGRVDAAMEQIKALKKEAHEAYK